MQEVQKTPLYKSPQILMAFQAVFYKVCRKCYLANLQIPSILSLVILTSSHSWQRLLTRGMSRTLLWAWLTSPTKLLQEPSVEGDIPLQVLDPVVELLPGDLPHLG